MTLRTDDLPPEGVLVLLQHCYRFVNEEWQHAPRQPIPDQGFETHFRTACVRNLAGWAISQHRELNLGCGADTASGVCHEVDIVVQTDLLMGILELKNRQYPPEKNDIIVFFAKILDYLALSPSLLRRHIAPIFVSSFAFEPTALIACLGLGIHPIAPSFRPLPMLIVNAQRMLAERNKGTVLSEADEAALDEYCTMLNRLSSTLADTYMNRRCTCMASDLLTVRAMAGPANDDLVSDFRSANAECSRLIAILKSAKHKRETS